jgi:hypothetical protein
MNLGYLRGTFEENRIRGKIQGRDFSDFTEEM